MSYTKEALTDKLIEIYPEIEEHGISMSLDFNDDENAWVIDFKKDSHELKSFLNKKDADDCMDGIKCVYLGVKIGEFIKNFEEG
jgi:dolichyl-phosphate-mannose--protein O-mannosyl transferase